MIKLPRGVADVLDDHVTFEVECVDYMYLNLSVPKLMCPGAVVGFFKGPSGHAFRVGGVDGPDHQDLRGVDPPLHQDRGCRPGHFVKGERKDDIAQRYLAAMTAATPSCSSAGLRRNVSVFRTERRVNPATGARYPFIVRASAVVNQFYFYGYDTDFGAFFFKFGTYFPYTDKFCLNGHHWTQRQAAKAGIGFEGLDNCFLSCHDPGALQDICDSFGPTHTRRSSGSSWRGCRAPSPPRTLTPVTTTTSLSCRPSSP